MIALAGSAQEQGLTVAQALGASAFMLLIAVVLGGAYRVMGGRPREYSTGVLLLSAVLTALGAGVFFVVGVVKWIG